MDSREPHSMMGSFSYVQAQKGIPLAVSNPPPAVNLSFSAFSPKPSAVSQAPPVYNGDGMQGMRPETGSVGGGDLVRKKRGRPRKYGPDGNLTPSFSVSGFAESPSGEPGAKRRGRPPGSGKKQLLDALGPSGSDFIPHVITVKPGENVASKIMAFSQKGPRTVCILSASGIVSSVALRQPATCGGTVTYEGRFEILSLSGSYMLTENADTLSRTGGLSVSLGGSDGRVLGGGVAGVLTAATPVQVIVGSFLAEAKKPKPSPSEPPPVPPPMIGFGGQPSGSPHSQGSASDSLDKEDNDLEDDDGSPLNQHHHGYSNSSGHHQHMLNIPPFTMLSWPLPLNQRRQ